MTRIVCITGVAGGIGAATAEEFGRSGWQVIGVDRIQPSATPSGIYRFVQADIREKTTIPDIFDDIARQEGRLDALVNNAAVQLTKRLVDTEPDEWDLLMAVNVRSVYLAIKQAFPLLSRQGGSIVNVSSVHAVATSDKIAAYATSKGALVALTRAAALELARDGIRVNAVLPGAIDTGMLRSGLTREHAGQGTMEQKLAALARRHALGRLGLPEEIARMILFLADNQSSAFMTGQSVIVDGGATAQLSTENT
jgi:NAD(P)-dependent dehydrogenase (short-subunit alcohol dehydrogenase family)